MSDKVFPSKWTYPGPRDEGPGLRLLVSSPSGSDSRKVVGQESESPGSLRGRRRPVQ